MNPDNRPQTLSRTEVAEMAVMMQRSPLVEHILTLYESRIFENDVEIEMTGLGGVPVALPTDFVQRVNDEWIKTLFPQVFRELFAYGMCVIRYMYADETGVDLARAATRDERHRRSRARTTAPGTAVELHGLKSQLQLRNVDLHVVPVADVDVKYVYNSVDNVYQFGVYRRTTVSQDPIPNVRVLYNKDWLSSDGRVRSILKRIYASLLAYDQMLVDVSTGVSRGAAHTAWGVERVEGKLDLTPEQLMEIQTSEETIGRDYETIRLRRIEDHARARAIADGLSRDNADDVSQSRVQQKRNGLVRSLQGAELTNGTVPLWVNVPPYLFDANEKLAAFPPPAIPANFKDIIIQLLTNVGSAVQLSAAFLLKLVQGNSTDEQSMMVNEQGIKRFVLMFHRIFERFLQTIFYDLYGPQFRAGLLEQFKQMQTRPADGGGEEVVKMTQTDVDSLWNKSGLHFFFRYTEIIPYEMLRSLFSDRNITPEEFQTMARNLNNIQGDPKGLVPIHPDDLALQQAEARLRLQAKYTPREDSGTKRSHSDHDTAAASKKKALEEHRPDK